jgi:hypothetical protein
MATEVFFFNKAALNDEAARAFILDLNLKSSNDIVKLSGMRYNAFWNKMPMSFYDMNPEEIFSLLNGEQNPFASEKKQEWIRANGISHTSMSVGDVIHITSKVIDRVVNHLDKEAAKKDQNIKEQWLICVGEGFAKLEFAEVVA